jgi:PadR family transcriptional regulator, regulatory protein PadR
MDGLTEMLKGTLEGCVLQVIGSEETYGYAITRRLNELGFADVIEGTVYTILLRLEKSGLVQVAKRPSGLGPPRKFYALNDAGRDELATFWAKWEYLSSRIDKLREGGDEPLGDHDGQRSHQGMEGVRSAGGGIAG